MSDAQTVISVTVTDGAVNYGTLSLGISQDTLVGHLADTQTATNNGNVAEDFNILSQRIFARRNGKIVAVDELGA